jgi:hypothetical protein
MNVAKTNSVILRRIVVLSLVTLLASLQSCKDMGNEPPKQQLTASTFLVTLSPGGSANVTISGGNPPYTISHEPSALLATASLTNNTDGSAALHIQATSALVSGRDSVILHDSDTHESENDSPTHEENEITIEILLVPPSGTVFFSADVQPILTNNCISSCHTPGGIAPFSLQGGVSRANLVNVQAVSSCTSEKRVLPGNAATSVLYKKISGTSCGNRMPLNLAPLSQADIDKIRDWIDQGAQNN